MCICALYKRQSFSSPPLIHPPLGCFSISAAATHRNLTWKTRIFAYLPFISHNPHLPVTKTTIPTMNKQVPIHEEEDIYEPSGYRWLIKWSGYDQSYNTWESTQDVYGKEVLNEFSRSVEAEMGNSVLKEKCRYILLRDAYDPEVAPVDKVNRSAGKAGGRARSASTSKHGTKGTKKEDKPGSARGTPPVSSSSGSHNNGLKRVGTTN
ncbi:hypothetical protein BC936DRAFT_143664 [Jimgerdemannia flammicorona]|uniref:Chromo domain-containing protein n=1 Tax=Jimgerdemannia flammicorona TaxID=994334 RepID=A0A432ZYV0_9FUNG|nr:hypothetical protein BC936DRAFT_143664 [Jimgerdemannia flammicorona]